MIKKYLFLDLLVYLTYRVIINQDGLLDSDDFVYFETVKKIISSGELPFEFITQNNKSYILILVLLYKNLPLDPFFGVAFLNIVPFWGVMYLVQRSFKFHKYFLFLLIFYPDLIYIRYHLFKDTLTCVLVIVFFLSIVNKRSGYAIAATLLNSLTRFYMPFVHAASLIDLTRTRQIAASILVILILNVTLITLYPHLIDVYFVQRDLFDDNNIYLLKEIANIAGLDNPLKVFPALIFTFLTQPLPHNLLIPANYLSIVAFSSLATYAIFLPSLIKVVFSNYKLMPKKRKLRRSFLMFMFAYMFLLSFEPILADMRHRTILLLPLFILRYSKK